MTITPHTDPVGAATLTTPHATRTVPTTPESSHPRTADPPEGDSPHHAEHPVGSVCWLDLGVADVDVAASFYSRLLGWNVAAPDDTGYRLASLRGHLVAAFGPAEDPGVPYWTVYVHTADITASVKAIAAAGGDIVVPPTRTGDVGVSAVVRDPHGAPLSLWQPGTHHGTDASGAHGTLAGVRLRVDETHDPREFLRAALGWRARSNGTITHHRRSVATWVPDSGTSRPDRPSPWLVCFSVADGPAAIKRALELGACPTDEGPDILVDPAGAAFAVTSVPTSMPTSMP